MPVPGAVYRQGNPQTWQNVDKRAAGICLHLPVVMRAAHRYESFYGHAYHQVDAGTQGDPDNNMGNTVVLGNLILPVERIMNIREYTQEMNRVEITKTIADSVHYGKHQVKAENTKLKRALELEIRLRLS